MNNTTPIGFKRLTTEQVKDAFSESPELYCDGLHIGLDHDFSNAIEDAFGDDLPKWYLDGTAFDGDMGSFFKVVLSAEDVAGLIDALVNAIAGGNNWAYMDDLYVAVMRGIRIEIR